MSAQSFNLGMDFLCARLHGLWSKAVQGDFLNELAESGTEDNFLQLLARKGVAAAGDRGAQFELGLKQRELALYVRLSHQTTPAIARYLSSFIIEFDLGNLKILLNDRFFPEDRLRLDELLIPTPALAEVQARRLTDPEAFAAVLLPLPDQAGTRDAIIAELSASRDLTAAENALDRLLAGRKLANAIALPASCRPTALALIRHEIDIQNIAIALRNITFYHFPPEILKNYLFDGGTIAEKALVELANTHSADELVSRLPATYASLLADLHGQQLHHFENALWTGLWRQANAFFHDANAPQNTLLAFPFLLRFETNNLVRAYEAVRFGLPANELKKMLICAPLS